MRFQLKFTFEKETKGAFRFKEADVGKFDEPKVGSLYIRKSALKELGTVPQSVEVTIEVPS